MIIDFHTHVFPSFFTDERDRLFPDEPGFAGIYRDPKSRLVDREALLGRMDEEGVDRSLIFGFPWEKEDHFQRHNDYIIESVTKYPDRLIGFCCFSPLSEMGPREAERCLDLGLSGVGELAVYHSDIPWEEIGPLRDVMEICTQREVPVLLHTNEPVGHSYPGKTTANLNQVYGFVKAHPSSRIVLAHWGGGLFFYALMKKEVKGVLKNVWFDTAASPYLYVPEIYRLAGEIVGYEKILFGSDYPLLEPARYFQEMASVKLTAQSIADITGRNAASLLGTTGEMRSG